MKKIFTIIAAAIMALPTVAQEPGDVMIFINPGHGGHDSDDRNVVIEPFKSGDPNGYWESNSNLEKGLSLKALLEAKGCNVDMSRVTNTTADDLGLSVISGLANDSGADIFFSIHSNATGTANRVNFPLMLFRGKDDMPIIPDSKVLSELLFPHLISNEATVWTQTSTNVRGDWSFYPSWGTSGLGVLRELQIPGMLSEGSFHDYIPETYRLMNKDFCWLEAWHFLKAIDDYWSFAPETKGIIAGVLYDERFQRDVNYIMFARDIMLPVSDAKVTLYDESGTTELQSYLTDKLYNGFFLFKDLEPGKYIIKMTSETHEPKEAEVTVTANKVSYPVIALKKIRNTPPAVLSYTPQWNEGDKPLLCNTSINLAFNWDMDVASTEAAFTITPAVEGVFTWTESNTKMEFKPKRSYKPNTLYTIKLAKTATHAGGVPLENDFTIQFATDDREFTTILAQYPIDGSEIHYKGMAVMMMADKFFDAGQIIKQVSMVNAAGAPMTFNTRSFSYNKDNEAYGWFKLPVAGNLNIGETYTLTLSGDISDKDGVKIPQEQIINFKAVDVTELSVGSDVITNFEDNTLYTLNADKSTKYTEGKITKDTSNKLFDAACVKFVSTFSEAGGEITYDFGGTSTFTINTNFHAGLYVNGDLSGCELSCVFESASGEKIVKACNIDFLGWKLIEIPSVDFATGEEYQFKGIKVKSTNALQGMKNTLILDNLLRMEGPGSGVENVEIASVKVYPNPASEYVIVNGDALVESLQLIGMNGAVVAQTAGNVINVSEIANGTYILKISISGVVTTRKVVILHE